MAPIQLRATSVAAGGDAIARDGDGRVMFVEGAIPGELVEADVVSSKRDYARSTVVSVIEPSADRVEPPCPMAVLGCGGCQWQHISLGAQRRMKREIVMDALRRLASIDDPPVSVEVEGVRADAYRTTLRLAVGADGRPSFHRRRSVDLLAPEMCGIAHPTLEELAVGARFPGAESVALRVSASGGGRLALVSPTAAGATVPGDVFVVGENDRRLLRRASITEMVAGRRWQISARSFFQPGPEAAELLVRTVTSMAGDTSGTVVDAYGGVGLLGGSLAVARGSTVERLIVIEQQRSSSADAVANLAGLPAEIVHNDVGRWRPEPADLVIADPARPGLGPTATRVLAAAEAPVIVLVSCDPASLARDVGLLAGHGYRLVAMQVLDLFPHTFHVEAVSRFERAA